MRLLLLIGLSLGISLTVQAHEKVFDIEKCLAESVEYLASIDAWSEPKRIKSSCACLIKKRKQGLPDKDCPIPGRIKGERIKKYFRPPN